MSSSAGAGHPSPSSATAPQLPALPSSSSGLLHNLLHEAVVAQHHQQRAHSLTANYSSVPDDEDRRLADMLEAYEQHVRMHEWQQQQQQQQQSSSSNIALPPSHPVNPGYQSPQRVSSAMGSHSQPCLTETPLESMVRHPLVGGEGQAAIRGRIIASEQPRGASPLLAGPAVESDNDNAALRAQIMSLRRKASRIPQLEAAYTRIELAYEGLVREREQNVDRTVIMELQHKYQKVCEERDMLARLLSSTTSDSSNSPGQLELANLQDMISKLLANASSTEAAVEQQKRELEAQRATLTDQRTHIAVLEQALRNAQEKAARVDQMAADLVTLSERAAAAERRLLEAESREREQATQRAALEMQLAQLNAMRSKETGGASDEHLRRVLFSKDERVAQLERSVDELQRRVRDETEKRAIAVDALTESFEARLRRLDEFVLSKDRHIVQLETQLQRQRPPLLHLQQRQPQPSPSPPPALASSSGGPRRHSATLQQISGVARLPRSQPSALSSHHSGRPHSAAFDDARDPVNSNNVFLTSSLLGSLPGVSSMSMYGAVLPPPPPPPPTRPGAMIGMSASESPERVLQLFRPPHSDRSSESPVPSTASFVVSSATITPSAHVTLPSPPPVDSDRTWKASV